MSDQTFCWLFTWVAITLGWFVRIVHVQFGQMSGFLLGFIGGALLVAALERRMSRRGGE
ncbi:hypothetical protein [Krasilnikovia sp. MM14-A1259]|uniref:hypothetical protein n=1 Tax=Krasilnikovia sp. MM14-A1259 TaxID=3373539 RepID=UPI00382F7DEA